MSASQVSTQDTYRLSIPPTLVRASSSGVIPHSSHHTWISFKQSEYISPKSEDVLLAIGKQLAESLARILEQLAAADNTVAIRSLLKDIQPFIEEQEQAISVKMPPKSSRQIELTITRREKAKPDASLD